jgi:hypothetical protein
MPVRMEMARAKGRERHADDAGVSLDRVAADARQPRVGVAAPIDALRLFV